MALGLFVLGFGHNVGAWRTQAADPADVLSLDYYRQLGALAERGRLDMVFFAEILYSYELMGRHQGELVFPTLDPLVLTAALASSTAHIGLAATYSTTYTDPRATAAKLASNDMLNGGRTAWNIVTTGAGQSAANFSVRSHPERHARYARASEYLATVKALWRAWSASPQGWPVFIQAGMSVDGRAFAAAEAEVLFTVARSIEEAGAFRAQMRELLPQHGRDPSTLRIMPGIAPILGATEAEARAKEEAFAALLHPRIQLALLGDQFGMDFSGFELDREMPMEAIMCSPRVASGERDPKRLIAEVDGRLPTLRQHLDRSAKVRSHHAFVGTPEQLADHMQHWFESGVCDGFNLMPPVLPGEVEVLVEELVPLLQRRGLFRTDYSGTTLREHLGLAKPGA